MLFLSVFYEFIYYEMKYYLYLLFIYTIYNNSAAHCQIVKAGRYVPTSHCPPVPGPPAPDPLRSSAHRGGRPGSRTEPEPADSLSLEADGRKQTWRQIKSTF